MFRYSSPDGTTNHKRITDTRLLQLNADWLWLRLVGGVGVTSFPVTAGSGNSNLRMKEWSGWQQSDSRRDVSLDMAVNTAKSPAM